MIFTITFAGLSDFPFNPPNLLEVALAGNISKVVLRCCLGVGDVVVVVVVVFLLVVVVVVVVVFIVMIVVVVIVVVVVVVVVEVVVVVVVLVVDFFPRFRIISKKYFLPGVVVLSDVAVGNAVLTLIETPMVAEC